MEVQVGTTSLVSLQEDRRKDQAHEKQDSDMMAAQWDPFELRLTFEFGGIHLYVHELT